MAQRVPVRLSKATLREIDRLAVQLKTTRSEAFRRLLERGLQEARIDRAVGMVRNAKASMGRAAEMAGVTLYEMTDIARERRIPSGYEMADLMKDIRSFGGRRSGPR